METPRKSDESLLNGRQMEAPKRSDESRLNRAYCGFGFLGLEFLLVGAGYILSATHWFNFDWGIWPEVFGVSVVGPLFVVGGTVWALINGIGETVRFRHPALVVLSAILITFVAVLIVLLPYASGWSDAPGLPIVDHVLSVAFGIYIAANILIPAWWFTRGRRRYRAKSLAQD